MKLALPGLVVFCAPLLLEACRSENAAGPSRPAAQESSGESSNARGRAVEAGLDWLARHQLPDGSWRPSGVDAGCRESFEHGASKVAWVDHYDVGSTALAALAFLRAGAPGEPAERALAWLRSQQNEQGSFSKDRSFLYNEALATLALVEHYAATKDAKELEPAQRAVDFLVHAQRPSPSGEGSWGWRYNSRMEIEQKFATAEPNEMQKRELYDSDVSCTSWAAAALVAARDAGLVVDPSALAGAANFVRWCRARDGLVGYNDPRNAGLKVSGRDDQFTYHPTCMSSVGLRLALELDPSSAEDFIEPAAKRISVDLPTVSDDGLSIDYYYWLHGTQALAAYDQARPARYFQAWDRVLRKVLIGLQDHKSEDCGRGAWLVPDRWSYAAGPVYTTAMALLALEQKG
ncbi:MAG: terpene cyclase/mutase family protein [Planctomycetes bacterium]|nr:terpene cyclase/mutase family protein [Planctomycetota bacterium]